uniref:ORF239 n=1 Tax=Hoilungia sp. H23 TaxID=2781605 RepID=A0A7U3NFZ5_9METZ|nr:ORF239 [Hoilungia sp. H23]
MSNRDLNVLNRVKNFVQCGRVVKSNPPTTSSFICSNSIGISKILNLVNGHMRLKVYNFQIACESLGIEFIPANYTIERDSAYLAGLIDTDGSIVFNFPGNRIELNLEFRNYKESNILDLSEVIEGGNCKKLELTKTNQDEGKIFMSVRYSYNTVKNMMPIYNYVKNNPLHCSFKLARCMKIKEFMNIRKYNKASWDSIEYQIYSDFVLDWISYLNPNWKNIPFVKKLNPSKIYSNEPVQ